MPVGKIDAIEPRAGDVKVTMSVSDDVKIPADAKAIIVSPNLVAARFIQLTPAYTGGAGSLADGASIGLDRTAVPVEWDEVKEAADQAGGPTRSAAGGLQGPLSTFVNQAADTFDGNGDSFRNALRELSQTAGRLGDSRGDLFGTVKNLQILVNALSQQQRTDRAVRQPRRVGVAGARRQLDGSRLTLGHAQPGARRCARASSTTTIDALIGR